MSIKVISTHLITQLKEFQKTCSMSYSILEKIENCLKSFFSSQNFNFGETELKKIEGQLNLNFCFSKYQFIIKMDSHNLEQVDLILYQVENDSLLKELGKFSHDYLGNISFPGMTKVGFQSEELDDYLLTFFFNSIKKSNKP